MQLVTYGAQDIYLTGNPLITYFKTVYRRHTNFSIECIEQIFDGKINFGNRLNCKLSRNGDLIHQIHLEGTLPDIANPDALSWLRWTDNVGHYLITSVDIEIGGKLIDRHYGDWLEIWAQLSTPAGQIKGYLDMIGQDRANINGSPTGLQKSSRKGRDIYIPLQFWFCRNVGLSLPLIALQYHDVVISIQLNTLDALLINTSPVGELVPNPEIQINDLNLSLWVDYIFLDTPERWRFAQVSHEYLIEQLQFFGNETIPAGTSNKNILLEFNQPVKEIVWVVQNAGLTKYKQLCNYTDTIASTREHTPVFMKNPYGAKNPVFKAKLVLNGHDRFSQRKGEYFNAIQTRAHTNIPESKGINIYSFALNPESHQPSGTCNFSRIDSANLFIYLKIPTDTAGETTANGVAYAKAVLGLNTIYSKPSIDPLINYINAQTSVSNTANIPDFPLLLEPDLDTIKLFSRWITTVTGKLFAWNKTHPLQVDNDTIRYIYAAQTYMAVIVSTDLLIKTAKFYITRDNTIEEYDQINKVAAIHQPLYIQGPNHLLIEAYANILTDDRRNNRRLLVQILNGMNSAIAVMNTVMIDDILSYTLSNFILSEVLLLYQIRNILSTIKRYTDYQLDVILGGSLDDPEAFKLDLSPFDNIVKIFAVNYNVLRIMSGMGGLAYSN